MTCPAQVADPPPRPKKPRTRLTAEEKAARAAERALERARIKSEAREAKIRAAGGPDVALPCIVLREGMQVVPCTAAQAEMFLQSALAELSIDVEHTGYPVGHNEHRITLAQLGHESSAVVFNPWEPDQGEVVRRCIAAARKLHAHNALADLGPLEAAGLVTRDAWDKMDDTVIQAKLNDPSSTDSDESGLKPLAKALGGDYAVSWYWDRKRAELFAAGGWLTQTTLLTPVTRSGWAQVPFCETFIRYAAGDVMDCAMVARLLPPLPPQLVAREKVFAKAWVPIYTVGTPLDKNKISENVAAREELQAKARLRVEELTDGKITNPKSSKQVAPTLIEMGYEGLPLSEKTGDPGAPKGVLEPLAAEGDELCQQILEYRRHDTALGLLLRPWNTMCEHGDGRGRTSIMSINADTGRTSARDFNMQQVSRQGGMRACWLAEPGCKGISADFSSVEIRVGAALSGDRTMKHLIEMLDLYPDRKKEFDFHWRSALICYGEGATKENRYNCKRVNFAKMYGSGKKSAAAQVGIPVAQVSAAFDAFEALAPEYVAWDKQVRAFIEYGGKSWTCHSGRVIWLPQGRAHAGGNYMIQGSAREFLVDAVLKWLDGPWGYATLLPVHDEIVAWNIPADEADAATKFLVSCMETELLGVKIAAEPNEPWDAWPDAS